MKTLADLINAMDFKESLELAKEICDSRLAGILSSDRDHVRQVMQIEREGALEQSVKETVIPAQEVPEMITFYSDDKTQDTLLQLGVKPCNKGFKYLSDSIQILECDPTYLDKVTALYYKVANMNDSTPSNIERAIRHSLSNLKGDMVYKIIPTCNEHYTNKEFLTYMMMYLNNKQ